MESAVKIILTNHENKVLLQLRDKDHSYTGCWALFGGHIDGDETPEEALVREMKEEINYPLKHYEFIRKYYIESFGRVYLFHANLDVGLDELTLGEGDDFRFFSYEEIIDLEFMPTNKEIVIEYLKGRENMK